jgi:hypothetical protein
MRDLAKVACLCNLRRIQRISSSLMARRISTLERSIRRLGGDLDQMLLRRGLRLHRSVPEEKLLVHRGMGPGQLEEFYRLLHRYSFRLWLRDLIKLRRGAGPGDLSSYCTPETSRRYLLTMARMGIVDVGKDGGWRLLREGVRSFGETLEWFVAEVLKREFFAQVRYGVSFRSPPPGGDFDVLASIEGSLIYVECKSSPPRGIEAEEVAGFLERCRILVPHAALFLVDTHLRMLDKIVPILEELLSSTPSSPHPEKRAVRRLQGEIFHVDHRVFVLNTGRLLSANIRACLLDFMKHTRSALAFMDRGF